jgi:hypothetical protein
MLQLAFALYRLHVAKRRRRYDLPSVRTLRISLAQAHVRDALARL